MDYRPELKERTYAYVWSAESGARMKDSIETIFLTATADKGSAGYVEIEFYFINGSKCDEVEKRRNAKAF